MSLTSRVANLFSFGSAGSPAEDRKFGIVDNGVEEDVNVRVGNGLLRSKNMAQEEAEEEGRPPYLHAMIAGGIGGTTGDLLMHSLDTVKTRQQGDPHVPPKYTKLSSSYSTILRQEGIRRGLYGGWVPALLGSFPGTIIFFGTYEYSKRHLIDNGIPPWFAYLSSGFVADFAASFVYVPSEVLKTRLQLQGRYNNPFFKSGYNYKNTAHAARTIVKQEGFSALFYGYRATIVRDLPFSALQFAFYEQGQTWARKWKESRDIGLPLELVTGAAAGGLAGVITCPLDVVKTRIQTQVISDPESTSKQASKSAKNASHKSTRAKPTSTKSTKPTKHQIRSISTSSPSTHTPRPGSIILDTSSVPTGLKLIYKTEGIAGLFRGVGPRFVWTSTQSSWGYYIFFAVICFLVFVKLLKVYLEWSAIWNMSFVISVVDGIYGIGALRVSYYLSRGNQKRGLLVMLVFFALGLCLRLSCVSLGCYKGGYGIFVQIGLLAVLNTLKWLSCMIYFSDCKERKMQKKVDEESGKDLAK